MKAIYKVGIAVAAVGAVFVVLQKVVSVDKIFQIGGVFALGLTVFAETGLLVGFFLPGDTLLFAAGFFAAQGRLNLALSIVILSLGAILGNMLGYEIGKRSGHKLFSKEDSILFHKSNLDKAQHFFDKHGGKTIILARFVPVVRTLSSPLAGMGHMNYKRFMTYNIIGAILWVPTMVLIGYWAGRVLGHYVNIDHYILPAALLATVATFGVSFLHILRDPLSRKRLKQQMRRLMAK